MSDMSSLVGALRQSNIFQTRQSIVAEMKALAARGVTPSWENFTELGNSAKKLRSQINADEYNRLRKLWKSIFDQIRAA